MTLNVQSQEKTYQLGEINFFPELGKSDSFGSIQVKQDERINSVISKHIRINESRKGVSGWRVQIYLGSGHDAMNTANRMKEDFSKQYPEYKVYLVYQAPFFKVRVGDFRKNDRTGALRLKKELEGKFKTPWIVEDLINYPSLEPLEK
jgi:hypothetical protein